VAGTLSTHMDWLLILLGIGLLAACVAIWKTLAKVSELQMSMKDAEMEKAVAQEAAKVLESTQLQFNERIEAQRAELYAEIEMRNEMIGTLQKEVAHQKGRAQSAHSSKGQILEKWTPFLQHEQIEVQWKPEDWSFLGNPLDYVVWEWYKDKDKNMAEGKIVLMDVKAAKSQLTTKQRRIRDLIKAGKVEWREIRLE